jgi:hypothetical protein
MWCWCVPLWSNPLLVAREVWQWFGEQREVVVGLECVAPGLVALPGLQSVGQLVWLARLLEGLRRAPGGAAVLEEAYKLHVWVPMLQRRPQYGTYAAAQRDVQRLLSWVPTTWVRVLQGGLQAAYDAGEAPPGVSAMQLRRARERVCGSLGWKLPGGQTVAVGALTVKAATRLQSLAAHAAIAPRQQRFVSRVREFDGLQQDAQLPGVGTVLTRWWRLKVPNTYKECAWRLALDAFPTARRMGLGQAPCVACGDLGPDVGHHFWDCPVAREVRLELEVQLRARGMLGAGERLSCAAVWLGVKPHAELVQWVWDMVCVAAIYAMEVGRSAAWSVSQRLEVPVLVGEVAGRAAKAALWAALADFAATARVPRAAQSVQLTRQPFVAMCVVLARGGVLRVVRH